jgi:hypothetical protein
LVLVRTGSNSFVHHYSYRPLVSHHLNVFHWPCHSCTDSGMGFEFELIRRYRSRSPTGALVINLTRTGACTLGRTLIGSPPQFLLQALVYILTGWVVISSPLVYWPSNWTTSTFFLQRKTLFKQTLSLTLCHLFFNSIIHGLKHRPVVYCKCTTVGIDYSTRMNRKGVL